MVVRGRAVAGGGSVTKEVTCKRMKTCLENKLNNLILSSSFVLYFPKSKFCSSLLWIRKQTSNMLFVSAKQIFLWIETKDRNKHHQTCYTLPLSLDSTNPWSKHITHMELAYRKMLSTDQRTYFQVRLAWDAVDCSRMQLKDTLL